jgi:hypothetical protein
MVFVTPMPVILDLRRWDTALSWQVVLVRLASILAQCIPSLEAIFSTGWGLRVKSQISFYNVPLPSLSLSDSLLGANLSLLPATRRTLSLPSHISSFDLYTSTVSF